VSAEAAGVVTLQSSPTVRKTVTSAIAAAVGVRSRRLKRPGACPEWLRDRQMWCPANSQVATTEAAVARVGFSVWWPLDATRGGRRFSWSTCAGAADGRETWEFEVGVIELT
jgi:hypothetical protein